MDTTYTKEEATRIAHFGAIKMDGQGYGITMLESPTLWADGITRHGGKWLVTAPEGHTYTLTADGFGKPDALKCHCTFFKKAKHGICKHAMRVSWLVKDLRDAAAKAAAEDAEYLRWIDSEIDAIDNRDGIPHPHLTGLGV